MNTPGEGASFRVVSSTQVEMAFDTAVYRLNAIKKAAYKFGDRFHIQIATAGEGRVAVTFAAKTPEENLQFWAGEFCNEVLDQELREVVAQETEAVGRVLLAQAFSATSLVDPAGDDGDYKTDPLTVRGGTDQS
jgi:His-Xaa-Ser system protein HxsD